MKNELKSLIQEAWSVRAHHRIEEFVLLVSRVRELVEVDPTFEGQQELSLLKVSLLRSRGEIAESKKILAEVQQAVSVKQGLFSSRFLLERGLNAFYEQDYSKALEDFLLVSSRASKETDAVLSAQGLMNALLCCEYQGLPAQNLSRSLAVLAEKPELIAIDGFRHQWQAYKVRQSWMQGDLSSLQGCPAEGWDQATYHLMFLKTLPFVSSGFRADLSVEDLMMNGGSTHLKSYRLRTLSGHSHPDDLKIHKIGEAADRIYLWTWQWLVSDDFSLEKILTSIEALSARMVTEPMLPMGLQMLKLSLGWIQLFVPGLKSRLQVMTNLIPGTVKTEMAIFELESLFQSYLRLRVEGNDAAMEDLNSLLKSHSLIEDKNLLFGQFVKDLREGQKASGGLAGLSKRLGRHLQFLEAYEAATITVRLDTMEASKSLSDVKIQSEPFCRAIALFKEARSVTCEEFLWATFQQKGYDAYLHMPRISNLLSRLRAWLPEDMVLQKRGSHIYANGSWENLTVLGSAPQFLPDLSPVRASRRQRPKQIPGADFLEGLGGQSFTRKELEEKLKKSRATANRILERWLKEGIVRSQGRGPAQKYLLVEHWRAL